MRRPLVVSYRERLLVSSRHRIVRKPLNHRGLELLRRSLGGSGRAIRSSSSGRATLVIVSLSECSVSVPNLISSEYLVDDGCVHPPSVNFSHRRARQSASLMTDAYIRRRSTSLVDESIICQDAGEECSSYIISKTRSSSLLFGTIVVSKLEADVSPTGSRSYCVQRVVLLALMSVE